MSEAPRFGTAGLSDSYRVRSFDPQAMAEYTASFGLTAFEYQWGAVCAWGWIKPPP